MSGPMALGCWRGFPVAYTPLWSWQPHSNGEAGWGGDPTAPSYTGTKDHSVLGE